MNQLPHRFHSQRPSRHQVRSVELRIDSLPDGGIRLSTPMARGWAAVARTPHELARAVSQALTEAQVAAYARWKGETYELDELTEVDTADPMAAPVRTMSFTDRRLRSDVHHPRDWAPLSDGTWRSPAGRIYRGDSEAVQRVIRKRKLLGDMGIDSA